MFMLFRLSDLVFLDTPYHVHVVSFSDLVVLDTPYHLHAVWFI